MTDFALTASAAAPEYAAPEYAAPEYAAHEHAKPQRPAQEPQVEGSRLHPLVHAGRWLASDLASTFLFVGLYALTHSVYLATGLAILGGAAHIAWMKWRGTQVDAMQWMSLGMVVVFGSASLLTHDPRFVMLKPTLSYAAVGVVMLKRGWMTRYMQGVVLSWSPDLPIMFGYVWSALMFISGALNLLIAVHGDQKLWAWFLGVYPITSKLVLFAVQYLTTRAITTRRVRAAGVAA
jgi:intracellular septation protein A